MIAAGLAAASFVLWFVIGASVLAYGNWRANLPPLQDWRAQTGLILAWPVLLLMIAIALALAGYRGGDENPDA